jgi:hypothetical protein
MDEVQFLSVCGCVCCVLQNLPVGAEVEGGRHMTGQLAHVSPRFGTWVVPPDRCHIVSYLTTQWDTLLPLC